MKKYILFAVTLLTTVSIWATDYVTYDGVRYEITSGTDVVVNHEGTRLSGNIVIPKSFTITANETATTYYVKGFNYWYNTSYSYSVSVLDLSQLTDMTSLNLYQIQSYVNTLKLPISLTSVSESSVSADYNGNRYIGAYEIAADDGAHFMTSEGVLYTKDGKNLVRYPCRKTGSSYTVLNTVETINSYAFYDNNYIQRVVMPTTLKTIGGYAFRYCDKLADVNFPDGLESIGNYAFRDCNVHPSDNLLVLPKTLKNVGNYCFYNAFYNKDNVTVEIPKECGLTYDAGIGGSGLTFGEYGISCNIIRSYMTDPANALNIYAFDDVNKIYIPKGYNDAYSKTGWSRARDYYGRMVETSANDVDANISVPVISVSSLDETNSLLKVTITTTEENGVIYYKPTGMSDDIDVAEWPIFDSTQTPTIDIYPNGCILKAVVKKDDKYSVLTQKEFKMEDYSCKTPVFNYAENSTTTTITNSTDGATVYYTDDGTDPSTSTTQKTYTLGSEITLNGNITYKAVAVKEGSFKSAIAEFTPNWFKCDKPTISYAAETANGTNVVVTLTPPASGGSCQYRIGSSGSFLDYINPVTVAQNTYVYYKTVRTNYDDSEVDNLYTRRSDITSPTPTIGIDEATKKLTLTADGFDIYYTLDPTYTGITPTIDSEHKYPEGGVTLTSNTKVTAIAHKTGYFQSGEASTRIDTWFNCPEVAFEQYIDSGTGTMKLSLSDSITVDVSNIDIYYRIGYSYSIKENGTKYTGPIPVSNGNTVYALAVKDGYNTSSTTSQNVNFTKNEWTQCAAPRITLDDEAKLVTITAADTLDVYYLVQPADSELELTPSTASTKYTEPFSVTSNGTVKAITAKSGYVNSSVTSASVENWFRLPNVLYEPQYEVNGDNKTYKMHLSHTVPGVTIRYYVNNSYYTDDTSTRKVYDGTPFDVSIGQYVHAMASKTGQVDSEWAYSYIQESSFKVQTPSVTSNSTSKEVILKTNTPNATMYYYTVDDEGKILTSGTKMASDTLKLTQNDYLKFYAVKDKMETSDTISYSVTDWFRLADVTITPFVEDNKLKVRLTHSDPNVTIYYGIGNYNSTVTSNLPYSTPISVSDGDRIYASAAKDHFQPANWRNSSWLYYSSYTCDQPTINIDVDTLVTIAHAEGSTVYYTLDGSDPTTASSTYSTPFKLTQNANIKAMAVQDGKINSSITSYDYNRFYVRDITFSVDSVTMTITTSTPGATIHYQYEAEGLDNMTYPHVYSGPFELQYNGYIYVQATKEGFNSSTSNYYPGNIVKCVVSEDSFDGHLLKLKSSSGATIWYTTNGQRPYENSNNWYDYVYKYEDGIAIESTGTIKAMATAPYMNESAVFEKVIDAFAGETGATTEDAGQLESSMSWANPATITEFTIEGKVNAADLTYIKDNMTSLQKLDLSKAKMEGEIPDNAFAGMPLVSYASPSNISAVGENIFSGCKDLAAVEWNSSTRLPNSSFDADVNPNLLLFLQYETSAPSNSNVKNLIVNGEAALITLVDDENSNFYSPREFRTKEISYTHNFEMTSGDGAGWETIALPFDVQRIFHESKGDLLPFVAWEAQGKPEEYKPFWLSEFTIDGFVDVASISANKPYIVCMPNNDRYASRFRLGGKVTFYGANITVPVTNPISSTRGNVTFTPNFQSKKTEGDVLALNMTEYEGHAPGSIFVNDARTIRPFEAYATSVGMSRRFISVAETRSMQGGEDTTGIEERTIEDNSNVVKVYNLSGILVKQGAKEDALNGLPKGVYIMNGKRVIVK